MESSEFEEKTIAKLIEMVNASDREIARWRALAERLQAQADEMRGGRVEPAPAQDEREAFEAWASSCGIACTKAAQAMMFANGRRVPAGGYILVETANAWAAWQARATRPAQTEQRPVEVMRFLMKHPFSGEAHTVEFTREEVADGMEDTLYEKLADLICHCEPVGETNVVDCNCDDYIYEFELVNAAPIAQTAHAPEPVANDLAERLNSVIAELKAGAVSCLRCDYQEDTATDDCVTELEAIAAALSAQRGEA